MEHSIVTRYGKIFLILLLSLTICYSMSEARTHQDGDCKVWDQQTSGEDWESCNLNDKEILYSRTGTGSLVGADTFLALPGQGNNATESNVYTALPRAGQFSKFGCAIDSTIASSTSAAFYLRVNSAQSALSCTISDTSTTVCTDDDDTVNVDAGNTIAVQLDATGSMGSKAIMCWVLFKPSTPF